MKKLLALKNKKGFTLVELVVVIVIIAILAAALVTSLVGYINKAKETNALLEANNVYVATQAYLSEFYGTNNVTAANTPTGATAALIAQVNDYLGAVLVDEARPITFTANSNGTITAFTYTTKGLTVTYTAGATDAWSVDPTATTQPVLPG